VRCPRCGNENQEGNRFCGMCGATLLAAPAVNPATPQRGTTTGSATASTAAATASSPQPAEAAHPVAPSQPQPSISGPSFLGLNDPAPRKRASLSIDPHGGAHSRNLDYLLDDDDEHRGGGAGKFFLILIALALAVGFGYLRWKNQGLPWLTSKLNKPSATAQNPTPEAESPATTPSITPEPQPPSPAPAAATPPVATPAAAAPAASPGNNGTPSPDAATPAGAAPSADGNANTPPAAEAKPDNETPTSDKQPAASPAPAPAETAEKPKPAKPAPAKPRAPSKPSPATDPVAEARKYLYGRGAAQDCDRGLRILKPAANAANPKAMIEMGALYSAGLCAPHDLPTAYRWFALALRKDPENQAAQTDLQKLWGEMTQPERQLAIKMSQ
jgi:hypothetical protein